MKPVPPSRVVRRATVLFAWICWGIAYWQSNWWWFAGSFVPYLLSNSFSHLLDRNQSSE